MPAARRPFPIPRRSRIRPATALLVCCFLLASPPSPGQTKPPPSGSPTPTGETRAAALKLPDGTIVLYTKNPDDPNPPIDAVILSAKEYKALVEQAENGKKGKDPVKPQSPSGCAIRAKVQQAGESLVTGVTLIYTVQTTAPRTTVNLGCARGFPRAARLSDGKLPVLGVSPEGLTAVLEKPGEHTLTVELDAPIGPRGSKGELGFDVGLPRAAITTFSLEPPPGGVKKVTVGTRSPDRPTETQRNSFPVDRLAHAPGQPLGPTDTLEVTWDAPTTTAPPQPTDTSLIADSQVTVRVDESQVEATAKIRLRGPAREWHIALPSGADVVATRATPPPGGPETPFPTTGSATLVRPPDNNRPIWTLKLPEGPPVEWTVTATVRVSRPNSSDPKSRGPYPIGPFAVLSATRQTTTLQVTAPSTVRVRFRHGAEVRPQNIPAGSDEELVGIFKTTQATPQGKNYPSPILELEATPARVFVRIEPTHRLKRIEAGWRLDTIFKVTPVRADVDQVVVDFPEGWQNLEAGPPEVVHEIQEHKEGKSRVLTIQLTAAHRSTFNLTLTGIYPVPVTSKQITAGLPRFRQAIEQNARVSASVPEGLEIRGTVSAWENGQPAGSVDLKPDPGEPKPGAGVTSASAQMEKGADRVEIGWQAHRPELDAEMRADITIQDRQAVVVQTIRFRAPDGGGRPIRLRGPTTLTGLRGSADPVGPGEWIFRPPTDSGKEVSLSLSFGIAIPDPKPGESARQTIPIGLIWPDSATRVSTVVRVWGATATRRVSRFEGPWRELPPEPDRDALPVLTLAGSGLGLPLSFELGEIGEGLIPQVWVDRALIQAWVGNDHVSVKSRFLLRRWSASGVEMTLPTGVVPEVSIDGRKVTDLRPAPGNADGTTSMRIPVGEPRPGRTWAILEIRHQVPTGGAPWGEVPLAPPILAAATFRLPPRWQVSYPADMTTLVASGNLQVDAKWNLRQGLVLPIANGSSQDLEQWFSAGQEGEAEGDPAVSATGSGDLDAIVGRQPVLGRVVLYRFPRAGWIAFCSLMILLVGVGLSRLRPGLLGPTVAVAGTLVACSAVIWPQPTTQVIAGCQPGLWVTVLLLAGQALLRWYHRRRVTHLPGFTRTRRDPVMNGTGPTPALGAIGSATGSASAPHLVEDAVPASGRS